MFRVRLYFAIKCRVFRRWIWTGRISPYVLLTLLGFLNVFLRWNTKSDITHSSAIKSFFQKRTYQIRQNDSSRQISSPPNSDQILILSWTTFYFSNFEMFLQCPHRRCAMTSDRTLIDTANVVMFHVPDFSWNDLPPSRRLDQYYVFFVWESPTTFHIKFQTVAQKSFFNLTMTYRRDSDVFAPYGTVIQRQERLRGSLKQLIAGKTRPVAWLVSHCRTWSRREVLVKRLKQFIPVDIFGQCGYHRCKEDTYGNINDAEACGNLFEKNYKFYVSFENSLCQDYVTEKFFRRLQWYSVPVVLQRQNIQHLCPEYEKPWFIAVDDFKSIEDFAAYLNYLNSNDTAYYEYLSWHEHYETVVEINSDTQAYSERPWCDLCAIAGRKEKKVIENIEEWWWSKDACYPDAYGIMSLEHILMKMCLFVLRVINRNV